MRTVLAVDLGKTRCRAAIWTDGDRSDAEGCGAPGLAAPDGVSLAEAAILSACSPLLQTLRDQPIEAIAIGAAGALAAPNAARELVRRLAGILPAAAMAVTSDAVTSHAGALGGEPGIVLAAGTGAVALGVGRDGAQSRADGWGPWLGDEGGGAWLGLQGLRAALRAVDGRGPATLLQAFAEARFGPLTGLAAVLEGHESPPRLAASFANAVAATAHQGDAVASDLMQRAARALAETALAAARALGEAAPLALSLTGGLAQLGPALLDPFREALRAGSPRLTLVPPKGTAIDGARLIAVRRDTVHEGRVIRACSLPAPQPVNRPRPAG